MALSKALARPRHPECPVFCPGDRHSRLGKPSYCSNPTLHHQPHCSALLLPCQPSSQAQILTEQCRRRLRAEAWTGTLCHVWHTGTAPREPLCGNCVEALWGRDFGENRGKSAAPLLPPPPPDLASQGLPTHWCSIWKLRCPLNQSLKKDCSTLQVAASCAGEEG